MSRSVCTGMVQWARLPISRCEGKGVWPRGRVLCMSRYRQVDVLRLLDERPRQLLLPYHCCGTSRGEDECVRNFMCWQIACRDVDV